MNKNEYRRLHMWIARCNGKARFCSFDKTHLNEKFEWANISGEYKRDLSDYMSLCKPCHRIHDMKKSCKYGHVYEITGFYTTKKSPNKRACKVCQIENSRMQYAAKNNLDE